MWDQRYSSDQYIYGTEPNRFLADNAGRLPRGKILCLAEGEGRNAVFLARQGYDVTAVDGSAVARDKALQLAEKHQVNITYLKADLASFDLGTEQWDGVVSIFAHLPAALRRSVHQRVCQALKPGGVLLLEAYTPAQLKLATGGPKDEDMMMSVSILEKELKPLHFQHLLELQRNIIEGVGHTGTGAVVQAIAVKE